MHPKRARRPPLPPLAPHSLCLNELPAALYTGRQLKDIASPTIPSAAGSQRFPFSVLPATAASPSPLLNAPSVDGWQPVPGARPLTPGGDMQPRIINGDIDKDMQLFPYVAYISWRFNSTMSMLCSGSLIGPSHVLTAAHVSGSWSRMVAIIQLRCMAQCHACIVLWRLHAGSRHHGSSPSTLLPSPC